MKKVPTTWDEVRFIDGYPGKYAIIARRQGQIWYVAGINAQQQTVKTTLKLPMFKKGTPLTVYSDNPQLVGSVRSMKYSKMKVEIPENGGIVIIGAEF